MGKLIVIEGSDGSGKATQTRKLFERLRDLDGKVRRVSFPNYESESSALIKMYLRGDFGGSAEDVNPYAAATFYAVDRFAGFFEWKKARSPSAQNFSRGLTTWNINISGCRDPT